MNSEEYASQYLALLLKSRKQVVDSWIQKPISGEEFVIEYLSEHPGPVYPSELAEKMQASTARVAAILRHLECISMVLRSEDHQDARRHPIVLSSAGISRAREIHQKRISMISDIFNRIGETETKEFIRITSHIIRICKEMEAGIEKVSVNEEGSA